MQKSAIHLEIAFHFQNYVQNRSVFVHVIDDRESLSFKINDVEDIIIHEKYTPEYNYDIALLKFKERLNVSIL